MRVYKLTDQDMFTRRGEDNQTHWELLIPVSAKGQKNNLCSDGVIHYYYTPAEAVLYNPIHAKFKTPRLFVAEASSEIATDGLKGGAKTLHLLEEIPLPAISIEQRVEFGIQLAIKVYPEKSFREWANRWLDGSDKTAARAARAGRAAWAALRAAGVAEAAAAGVAEAAAAEAAARAAARAAEAEAGVAEAALRAAEAAAGVAEAALRAAGNGERTIIKAVLKKMGWLHEETKP